MSYRPVGLRRRWKETFCRTVRSGIHILALCNCSFQRRFITRICACVRACARACVRVCVGLYTTFLGIFHFVEDVNLYRKKMSDRYTCTL